ncbi:hypothetical protein PVAP13_1NG026300 [Panicum virgatum]|uniref:Uncharacterized protein n=1 Tax=Panicum virgatum TaxID=38727 RepID=A0A8T0WI13_PANVG|nr:hypothetical protein PVAP13_1NG026300 [Panicum virgatum]
MMAVKGYFRAPRLHGRKQQQAELYGGESPSAALLDVGDEMAAAVPRWYFAVYVGPEARRFVVPTSYLRQPAFRDLMERAAEEFGFAQAGGIRIPCREDFEAIVAALDDAAAARRRRRNCPRPGRCSVLEAGQPCMQNCSHGDQDREENKGLFSSQTDLINSNQGKRPLVSIMLLPHY